MKPCINCDESTAFTVNAIGVDTQMCGPCFEANAICCEWCNRRGSEEDMQGYEALVCNECAEEAIKEAYKAEEDYYDSLRMVWSEEDHEYVESGELAARREILARGEGL